MDRREREQILGEWGLRDPSPPEQGQVRRLGEDLEGSPLRGRPLPRRLRNFRPAVDLYVSSQGGPLPYMARLRDIEDETATHEAALADAWRALAAACAGDAALFSRRWHLLAERWNFTAVNDLIDRHNRYFPIEARLPMDPRTGDFVKLNGRAYRREPLGSAWVLERFPPELACAAA